MSSTRGNRHTGFAKKRFVPKEYQQKCIEFGLSRRAAGFLLAPGLGKTMIMLTIFRLLKELGYADELFVLSKKKVVYHTWRQEIAKWNLPFEAVVVHGSKKAEALYSGADVKLMNFEGLKWLSKQKAYFKGKKKIILCCDESSKLRNTNTVRFKTLRRMLHHFIRRYIMTGSPTPKSYINLFGQVYVLDRGHTLGRYITHFRNTYFTPVGYMGKEWALQDGAEKRLFKRIKPLVIRYGTDQLKLPPLKVINRWVTLPEGARKIYDKMENTLVMQVQEGEITAANAAVAHGKLRQIASGGIYTDERKDNEYYDIHDAKNEDLLDLLEELNGEPALVSFEFHHDEDRLRHFFQEHAPEFADAPYIKGGTKEKDVDRYLRKWNAGSLPVLFANMEPVAHGLNLQGKGGIVIYYAMTSNLESYEQFYKRVWRQGQERRVLVYRIMARNTVDEDMRMVIKSRDRSQRAFLKAMERRHGIQ